FLSELTGDFGEFIAKIFFKKKFILPKFIDIPLRSLKYLLLAFFIYAIFILMSGEAVWAFLDSPYNLTADIKMYLFFADISGFALTVLIILFVLSIFILSIAFIVTWYMQNICKKKAMSSDIAKFTQLR
ncbi:MAG: hypothetical protein K1X37_09610, partial [Saprospiraceae bacterium]|nr:hypothetical protein [Saprospiraceae bacterium]